MTRAQAIADRLLEAFDPKDELLSASDPDALQHELESLGYEIDWTHAPKWGAWKELRMANGPSFWVSVNPYLPGARYKEEFHYQWNVSFWERGPSSTGAGGWFGSTKRPLEFHEIVPYLSQLEEVAAQTNWESTLFFRGTGHRNDPHAVNLSRVTKQLTQQFPGA